MHVIFVLNNLHAARYPLREDGMQSSAISDIYPCRCVLLAIINSQHATVASFNTETGATKRKYESNHIVERLHRSLVVVSFLL